MKKNNVQWFEGDKQIQCSIERFFQREGEFDEALLNQEGAFVDILRAVGVRRCNGHTHPCCPFHSDVSNEVWPCRG